LVTKFTVLSLKIGGLIGTLSTKLDDWIIDDSGLDLSASIPNYERHEKNNLSIKPLRRIGNYKRHPIWHIWIRLRIFMAAIHLLFDCFIGRYLFGIFFAKAKTLNFLLPSSERRAKTSRAK
jgi:hypothetical protein